MKIQYVIQEAHEMGEWTWVDVSVKDEGTKYDNFVDAKACAVHVYLARVELTRYPEARFRLIKRTTSIEEVDITPKSNK